MFKVSLRDLFWLTTVAGLGTCLYLSLLRETKLKEQNVRLDWKTRVLWSEVKSQGGSVKDDGRSIVVATKTRVSKWTPIAAESWENDGSHNILTNFRSNDGKPMLPYAWPPAHD